MRRRALLASGTALFGAVAGCLSSVTGGSNLAGSGDAGRLPTASLRMDPIEDSEIPAKLLYTVTPEGSGKETPRSELVDRAARDGSATVERTEPPLPENRPLAYGDTVYRLDYEVTEEVPATRFGVKIDVVTGDEPEGRTVRFADLPKVDRQVFERNGFASGEVVGIGTTLLYTQREVERSALVPETDVVVIEWDSGNEAEWVVDDSWETTLNTYRYTIEETTPASEYGAEIRARFAWELSGLSEAEREIVETTVEGERYAVGPDETPPEALVSLVERFRPHDRVWGSKTDWADAVSGPYLVRYDGTVYWTQLSARGPAFGTPTPV